jgi:hypothetical protein
LSGPGEKVQIDVEKVPYNCLKGAVKRDGKYLYQWTAIDGYARLRYVFGYWEHTPENSVDFLGWLRAVFPFPTQNQGNFLPNMARQTHELKKQQSYEEIGVKRT